MKTGVRLPGETGLGVARLDPCRLRAKVEHYIKTPIAIHVLESLFWVEVAPLGPN